MNRSNTYHTRSVFRQRGLASVEFAIGLVVILLMMLVSAEIGRIYYSYNTLTKAVRNGSRYLSTVALNSASVMDLTGKKMKRTKNLVIKGNPGGTGNSLLEGLTSKSINISQYNSNEPIRQYVKVSAAFRYQPMLGVISGFGFGEDHDFGFKMKVTSTMRVLK